MVHMMMRTYKHGVVGIRTFGNGIGARFAITYWGSHSVLHMVLVGVLYDTFGVAFGGFIVLREASST